MKNELTKIKSNISKEVVNTLRTYQAQQLSINTSLGNAEPIGGSQQEPVLRVNNNRNNLQRSDFQKAESRRTSSNRNSFGKTMASELDRSIELRTTAQKQSPSMKDKLKSKENSVTPKGRKVGNSSGSRSVTKNRVQATEDLL